MKRILCATIITLFINNLYAKNVTELIDIIKDQNFTMEYYFFKSKKQNYFLAREGDDGIKMWRYTKERKWQPVHNTGSFAGFPEAPKLFDSVTFKDGNISIGKTTEASGGAVIDPTKPPPSPDPTMNSLEVRAKASDYIDELQNGSFQATHYFWRVKKDDNSTYAFLVKVQNMPELSLYYLDVTKWQPLYNAKAFDGFDAADKTLKEVSFDIKTLKLTIVGNDSSNKDDLP